jgi:hypothetical protein
MPYSPPMPYADTPQSAPIPLTPLVFPGEDPSDPAAGGGGGGGGMITKFFALPLIVILPILLPLILIIVVLGGGGGGGAGGGNNIPLAAVGNENNNNQNYETTPYFNDMGYGNDYPDENNNNDNNNRPNRRPNNPGNPNRNRRQVEKNSSSALPTMSINQVERLTQVVFAAMNSQECIQRLLCEVGSLSRSFSDASETVTKAVEDYVPEKLKDSYNVFAKAEKCEQYRCGSLKVKN